jgi:hypothetical protein
MAVDLFFRTPHRNFHVISEAGRNSKSVDLCTGDLDESIGCRADTSSDRGG